MYIPQWFAAYTYPRHEKKAESYLKMRGIETFLPSYKESHLWKNGVRKSVTLPLFPGYLFVQIPRSEQLKVLQTPSIATLVGSGGSPTPIAKEEIERLREGALRINLLPHPYLTVGDRVRVKSGPFTEAEGLLVSFKNSWRVVISIEFLRQSFAVEVDLSQVERVTNSPQPH